jgi:hypothetical protein
MTLKAILAGAAVLMVCGPAFAQSTAPTAQTTPGAPSTDQKPTPPATDAPMAPSANMPGATQPDTNNTATSPAAPSASTPPATASGSYGAGWNEQKCADARKKGTHVDTANCPAPPKPKA